MLLRLIRSRSLALPQVLTDAIRAGAKFRKKSHVVKKALHDLKETKKKIDDWYKKKGQMYVKRDRLVKEEQEALRRKILHNMSTEPCHRVYPGHPNCPVTIWNHGMLEVRALLLLLMRAPAAASASDASSCC